jgi:thiamine biosynthesis lipoprotein
MGSYVEITTDASIVAAETAAAVVARLERRWSRLDPGSELRRLAAAGGPVVARPSTARILALADAGRRLTDGWFDATGGCDPVLDAEQGLVHVTPGAVLDLNGIAKGWAADTAAALLRDAGASWAGVSVGGDTRVWATTRVLVTVGSPLADTPDAVVALRDGGVAVSGPTPLPDGAGHHLVDPFTGRPAERARYSVVVAATAAGAEMLATATAIAPRPTAVELVARCGATAWLVERDGSTTAVGDPDAHLVGAGWLGP